MIDLLRRAIVPGLVLVVAACGGGATDSEPVDEPVTTEAPTTVAPSTTLVSWAEVGDILTFGTEQALPSVEGFADALREENARLGATDGLDHDADEAEVRFPLAADTCTEVGFVRYQWSADVAFNEPPSVGIYSPVVTIYVCADAAARDARATRLQEIHSLPSGSVCPVASFGVDSTGTQICEARTNSGNLNWWNALSLGVVDDLALVAVSGDLWPDTDPAAGAASMEALVQYASDHLTARLA